MAHLKEKKSDYYWEFNHVWIKPRRQLLIMFAGLWIGCDWTTHTPVKHISWVSNLQWKWPINTTTHRQTTQRAPVLHRQDHYRLQPPIRWHVCILQTVAHVHWLVDQHQMSIQIIIPWTIDTSRAANIVWLKPIDDASEVTFITWRCITLPAVILLQQRGSIDGGAWRTQLS